MPLIELSIDMCPSVVRTRALVPYSLYVLATLVMAAGPTRESPAAAAESSGGARLLHPRSPAAPPPLRPLVDRVQL